MKNKKISKLSDHDKLINLIAVQGEKDVNHLLRSVDQVFIEVFNLKKTDLPWLSNNSEEEWVINDADLETTDGINVSNNIKPGKTIYYGGSTCAKKCRVGFYNASVTGSDDLDCTQINVDSTETIVRVEDPGNGNYSQCTLGDNEQWTIDDDSLSSDDSIQGPNVGQTLYYGTNACATSCNAGFYRSTTDGSCNTIDQICGDNGRLQSIGTDDVVDCCPSLSDGEVWDGSGCQTKCDNGYYLKDGSCTAFNVSKNTCNTISVGNIDAYRMSQKNDGTIACCTKPQNSDWSYGQLENATLFDVSEQIKGVTDSSACKWECGADYYYQSTNNTCVSKDDCPQDHYFDESAGSCQRFKICDVRGGSSTSGTNSENATYKEGDERSDRICCPKLPDTQPKWFLEGYYDQMKYVTPGQNEKCKLECNSGYNLSKLKRPSVIYDQTANIYVNPDDPSNTEVPRCRYQMSITDDGGCNVEPDFTLEGKRDGGLKLTNVPTNTNNAYIRAGQSGGELTWQSAAQKDGNLKWNYEPANPNAFMKECSYCSIDTSLYERRTSGQGWQTRCDKKCKEFYRGGIPSECPIQFAPDQRAFQFIGQVRWTGGEDGIGYNVIPPETTIATKSDIEKCFNKDPSNWNATQQARLVGSFVNNDLGIYASTANGTTFEPMTTGLLNSLARINKNCKNGTPELGRALSVGIVDRFEATSGSWKAKLWTASAYNSSSTEVKNCLHTAWVVCIGFWNSDYSVINTEGNLKAPKLSGNWEWNSEAVWCFNIDSRISNNYIAGLENASQSERSRIIPTLSLQFNPSSECNAPNSNMGGELDEFGCCCANKCGVRKLQPGQFIMYGGRDCATVTDKNNCAVNCELQSGISDCYTNDPPPPLPPTYSYESCNGYIGTYGDFATMGRPSVTLDQAKQLCNENIECGGFERWGNNNNPTTTYFKKNVSIDRCRNNQGNNIWHSFFRQEE